MQASSWDSPFRVQQAARAVWRGGIVAYPTEGVYGLGCLPQARQTVERLLAIKRRSWRKGLAIIGADLAQLEPLVIMPQGPLRAEILSSWPGPVTWALEARAGVPSWLSGGRNTLAVRVTDHPLARRLCLQAGSPLVSTSANRSGHPPCTRALQVRREFGGELDYVLAGALGGLTRPTTVRDGLTGAVLREP